MIYRLRFCNKDGVEARVDIQKGSSTPVIDVEGTEKPFTLSYNNDKGNKSGMFLSSSADIEIYETVDFNIDNLKTSNETELAVTYYINNVISWKGFIIPDFFSIEVRSNPVIVMTASDRLGTLKSVTLSDLPSMVNIRELSVLCLNKTGLTLPLKTMSDFSNDDTDNAFFSYYVDSQRIKDIKGRSISCYDILSSILTASNSKLVQRGGEWLIINKLQHEIGSGKIYSSLSSFINYLENIYNFEEVSIGARRTIMPVAGSVGIYHEHGGRKSHPVNYDFSLDLSGWNSMNGFTATIENRHITWFFGGTPLFDDERTVKQYLLNYNNWIDNTNNLNTAPYISTDAIPINSPRADRVEVTVDISSTMAEKLSSNTAISFLRYAVILTNGVKTYTLTKAGIFEELDPENISGHSLLLRGGQQPPLLLASPSFSNSESLKGLFEVGEDDDVNNYSATIRVYGSGDQYVTVNYALIKFSDVSELPKGTMYKTEQGEVFTKAYDIETSIFGDYLLSGLDGYFYRYPNDDTSSIYKDVNTLSTPVWTTPSIPNEASELPLLHHSMRQMRRMFSVAHDLLSAEIEVSNFDPLAIFVSCNKRYTVVSAQFDFFKSNLSVELEEVAFQSANVRDYIYSYFGGGDDNIKSIGGISEGVGGGTGGGLTPQIDPRVSELKSYLEVVNTDLARLNETYNIINDSTVIGTMVKTQLNDLKDNLDASAGAFISYATDALADGKLTEEEIEEIDTRKETYLTAFGAFMAFAEPIYISLIKVNILKDDLMKYAREKAQIDSVYPGLYGHTYLTGGTKTAYAAAKTAYDSAYYDLVNTIDSYIFDGMVSPAESDMIQYYVGIYNTKIAEYKQAEENVKAIISLVTGYYEKLRTYAADKSRADNVYLLVYNNIYLVGADKTAYASAKTAYDTAYTNVVSGINTIISTGTLTPSEISAVSDLIDEYLSKLSLLIAAEETARKAIGEEQKRQAQVYAESLFDDVVETQEALENSLLKYSESINPITAQMMQLIVGDESLQFHFVESKVNPVRVSHSISYLSGTLTVYAGWIKHLTLGITDISPTHEYKFWNVPLSTFGSLDPDKYYYLYAKCSTSAETGEYILSETPIEIDGVSGYYHLLMGILNSENNSTRRFAQLYGFTEILPGRITTDKIVSQDGKTYFDLITALLSIGDGKIVLDGSDGSGHFANGNISWDDDGSGHLARGKISWDDDGNLEVTDGASIGDFTIENGQLVVTYSWFTYVGSNYVQVTQKTTFQSSGILIEASYGGTVDHPQVVSWNAKFDSGGVTVGSMELRRDGLYRNGLFVI